MEKLAHRVFDMGQGRNRKLSDCFRNASMNILYCPARRGSGSPMCMSFVAAHELSRHGLAPFFCSSSINLRMTLRCASLTSGSVRRLSSSRKFSRWMNLSMTEPRRVTKIAIWSATVYCAMVLRKSAFGWHD
jgi:hypothetical protein